MSSSTTIAIGGHDYTIGPFKGRRGVLLGRMVTNIMSELLEVYSATAQWERQYRIEKAYVVTRAEAQERGETWMFEEGGPFHDPERTEVKIPRVPTDNERDLVMFSKAFEIAETQVLQLLALIIVTDDELRAMRESGKVYDKLSDRGERLLDDATFGELVELAGAAVQAVEAEMEARLDPLHRLTKLYRRATRRTAAAPASAEPAPRTEPMVGSVVSTPEAEPDSQSTSEREQTSSTSSTSSPVTTTGAASGPSASDTPISSGSPAG